MWVKTVLRDEGVELFWQKRTIVVGGDLVVIDSNGNEESRMPLAKAEYPESMVSAGMISIDDDFAEYCGELFDDAVAAVMRHVAEMVAVGYGDSPEEVVEWYNNFSDMSFLSGTSFKFVYSMDPFLDMVGLTCSVADDEENGMVANIIVDDEEFEVALDSRELLLSFVICTCPV